MAAKVYIGVREDGTVFRPSQWPEMLAGIACKVTTYGNVTYSPYLYPVYRHEAKGISIDDKLEITNKAAYDQAMLFVLMNKLKRVE